MWLRFLWFLAVMRYFDGAVRWYSCESKMKAAARVGAVRRYSCGLRWREQLVLVPYAALAWTSDGCCRWMTDGEKLKNRLKLPEPSGKLIVASIWEPCKGKPSAAVWGTSGSKSKNRLCAGRRFATEAYQNWKTWKKYASKKWRIASEAYQNWKTWKKVCLKKMKNCVRGIPKLKNLKKSMPQKNKELHQRHTEIVKIEKGMPHQRGKWVSEAYQKREIEKKYAWSKKGRCTSGILKILKLKNSMPPERQEAWSQAYQRKRNWKIVCLIKEGKVHQWHTKNNESEK